MQTLISLALISLGAALGAGCRWGISLGLNPLFSHFALGTLVANYTGCLIMGLLMAVFIHFPQVSPEWRLFLVTGFLGSFTTFSSFSGEVVENLLSERWLAGVGIVLLHVLGCLLFTLIGFVFYRWVRA